MPDTPRAILTPTGDVQLTLSRDEAITLLNMAWNVMWVDGTYGEHAERMKLALSGAGVPNTTRVVGGLQPLDLRPPVPNIPPEPVAGGDGGESASRGLLPDVLRPIFQRVLAAQHTVGAGGSDKQDWLTALSERDSAAWEFKRALYAWRDSEVAAAVEAAKQATLTTSAPDAEQIAQHFMTLQYEVDGLRTLLLGTPERAPVIRTYLSGGSEPDLIAEADDNPAPPREYPTVAAVVRFKLGDGRFDKHVVYLSDGTVVQRYEHETEPVPGTRAAAHTEDGQ